MNKEMTDEEFYSIQDTEELVDMCLNNDNNMRIYKQQLDQANKKLDELRKIFKDYNIQKPVSGLSQCTYEITAEEMYKISQIIEESDK